MTTKTPDPKLTLFIREWESMVNPRPLDGRDRWFKSNLPDHLSNYPRHEKHAPIDEEYPYNGRMR